MPYINALNQYGTARWIVSGIAGQGTHTTISSAISDASSGDTIFIRPGTYTEDPGLKAGVNLAAYASDAYTPTVQILGKCSFSSAGQVNITGICLQTNSDYAISITGSTASIVNLINCNIIADNNDAVEFSSSSSSAAIVYETCTGQINNSGLAFYDHSSPGFQYFRNSNIGNSGGTTTASNNSDGFVQFYSSTLQFPISNSTGGRIQMHNSLMDTYSTGGNATCITTADSGNNECYNSYIFSGSGTAISIGSGTTLYLGNCTIVSSNTDAITGSGTLEYLDLVFQQSSLITTSTQTQMANGSPLNGANGGTGVNNSGLTINLGSGSTGYLLTSDSSGNATWQAGGGGGTYYSVTPYVVGADTHSQFTTVQAAVAQIVTDGVSDATVYIKPGSYYNGTTITTPANVTINFIGLCGSTFFQNTTFGGTSQTPDVQILDDISTGYQTYWKNIQFNSQTFGADTIYNTMCEGCCFYGSTLQNTGIQAWVELYNCTFNNGYIYTDHSGNGSNMILNCFNTQWLNSTINSNCVGTADYFTFNSCFFNGSGGGAILQNYSNHNPVLTITNCFGQRSGLISENTVGSSFQANVNGLVVNNTSGYSLITLVSGVTVNYPTWTDIVFTGNVGSLLNDSGPGVGSSLSFANSYLNLSGFTLASSPSVTIYNSYFAPSSGTVTGTVNLIDCVGVGLSSLTISGGASFQSVISTSPQSSDALTTAFGALAVGAALQNTTGGNLLVNVAIDFSSATSATILAGVDIQSSPTQDQISNSLTGLGTFNFSITVPSGFYLLVTTSGTITTGTVTTFASGI